jgi:hypothetical protein
VRDSVEYVHFGKGLEYDGERWVWEEDVDLWSEMSRFSTICGCYLVLHLGVEGDLCNSNGL